MKKKKDLIAYIYILVYIYSCTVCIPVYTCIYTGVHIIIIIVYARLYLPSIFEGQFFLGDIISVWIYVRHGWYIYTGIYMYIPVPIYIYSCLYKSLFFFIFFFTLLYLYIYHISSRKLRIHPQMLLTCRNWRTSNQMISPLCQSRSWPQEELPMFLIPSTM